MDGPTSIGGPLKRFTEIEPSCHGQLLNESRCDGASARISAATARSMPSIRLSPAARTAFASLRKASDAATRAAVPASRSTHTGVTCGDPSARTIASLPVRAGAAMAGVMLGLRDIYEGPPKDDTIVAIVESPDEPGDIDSDGISVSVGDVDVWAPPPVRSGDDDQTDD